MAIANYNIDELIRESQTGNISSKHKIVILNERLIWSVVHKYRFRVVELEDLFQIGCIGLMKCIDKFNFDFNVKFATYAVPMIQGEIQRYLRDDSILKISRSIKELGYKIRIQTETFRITNGREPTNKELAILIGVPLEDIFEAINANKACRSIDEVIFEGDKDNSEVTLLDQLVDEKPDDWFEYVDLKDIIKNLPERSKFIIVKRYYEELTQSEVGVLLGITQVQISRLEKRILIQIRSLLQQKIKEPENEGDDEEMKNGKITKKIQVFELLDAGFNKEEIIKLQELTTASYVNYKSMWNKEKKNQIAVNKLKRIEKEIEPPKFIDQPKKVGEEQQFVEEPKKVIEEPKIVEVPREKIQLVFETKSTKKLLSVDLILIDGLVLAGSNIYNQNVKNGDNCIEDIDLVERMLKGTDNTWNSKIIFFQNDIINGSIHFSNIKDYKLNIKES
jgi:RNA polymerase sporulation-specific sigma factor